MCVVVGWDETYTKQINIKQLSHFSKKKKEKINNVCVWEGGGGDDIYTKQINILQDVDVVQSDFKLV